MQGVRVAAVLLLCLVLDIVSEVVRKATADLKGWK